MSATNNDELIPAPKLAKNEFDVDRRTIGRWIRNPALGFPRPVRINGRLYFRRDEIESWKRSRLRQSIMGAA